MPISTTQLAVCVGSLPSVITKFIRGGELKAEQCKNGRYKIRKEDLADFFIAHPTFWRRFITHPIEPRYTNFHNLMLREVRKKTGRSGPLYYTLLELSVLLNVSADILKQMIKAGKLPAFMSANIWFVREEDVLDLIQKNDGYTQTLLENRGTYTKDRWMTYLSDRLIRLQEESTYDNEGSS